MATCKSADKMALRAIFDWADRNKTGCLSKAEINWAFNGREGLKQSLEKFSMSHLKEFFKNLMEGDKDKSGTLDYGEFCDYVNRRAMQEALYDEIGFDAFKPREDKKGSKFATSRIDEVMNFWVGAPGSIENGQFNQKWFTNDANFDNLIRAKFGRLYEDVKMGKAEGFSTVVDMVGPRALLATMIVLDQLGRNLNRNSTEMFSTDKMCAGWANDAIELGWWKELPAVERCWLYMPLHHSESLEDQETSVQMFRGLPDTVPFKGEFVRHAERYLDAVRRFGRLPHRNKMLGRETTTEERAWLAGVA